jgi:hypothetical protein
VCVCDHTPSVTFTDAAAGHVNVINVTVDIPSAVANDLSASLSPELDWDRHPGNHCRSPNHLYVLAHQTTGPTNIPLGTFPNTGARRRAFLSSEPQRTRAASTYVKGPASASPIDATSIPRSVDQDSDVGRPKTSVVLVGPYVVEPRGIGFENAAVAKQAAAPASKSNAEEISGQNRDRMRCSIDPPRNDSARVTFPNTGARRRVVLGYGIK